MIIELRTAPVSAILAVALIVVALTTACRSNDAKVEPSQTPAQASPPSSTNASGKGSAGETNATASNENSSDAQPKEPGDNFPASFEGTSGATEKRRRDSGMATLRAVRAATHGNFDRIVFEFAGSTVPGYRVEYVDKPVRQCGSGKVTPLAGDGWLSVRFTPAQAHTDEGKPTVAERERRLNLNIMKELKITCDFEGEVTWVMGVASPNRYRVLELASPARLVVDVKH